MNRIRIGLVGLVVTSLTGLAAGGASAAASGAGTASSSISLLSLDLGNVQHLKVLTDQAQGTLDPARLGLSGPQAFASLSAVDASGLLNQSVPNPAFKASAPGTSNFSSQPMSVSFPQSAVSAGGTSLPIGPGLLANGTVNPVRLEAHNGDSGVDSIAGTDVPKLSVLQGLIDVQGVRVAGLSSSATPSSSKGDTGIVSIERVDVLSLKGLLGMANLNVADLPLSTLTKLVDSLGLPVKTGDLGLGNLSGGDINGILGTATGLVSTLTSVAGVSSCSDLTSATSGLSGLPGTGDLLGTGTGILGGVLSQLPVPVPVSGIGGLLSACNAGNLTATVTSVAGSLTSALNGLKPAANSVLGDLLGTLTDAPLIQLSGVSLGALAQAGDTLAHSSATTSASFGHIKVGGKDLGKLDANSAVDQINAKKTEVLGLLNTVTTTIGLGNLIDIGMLERSASTKTEGAYNVAAAGLDLLRVSINPPANLPGLLSTATANPVSGLLGTLGGAIPLKTGLADGVLAQAFGVPSLLSQPTTIKVGSIGVNADHTTAAAGSTVNQGPTGSVGTKGTLPKTGGTNGAWFAAMAAISLAGAFGITRSLRRSPVTHSGPDDQ